MVKTYKNEIIVFYILSAAALIAAAFADLKIDILLNNPENPFAVWFYNTGEIPCRLICPLAGTVLFYSLRTKIGRITGALISLGGSMYLGYYLGKHFFVEENQMAFSLVFGLGIGFILLLAGKLIVIPDRLRKPLIVLAIAGIAVMAVQLSLVELLKTIWGRVRFRDLTAVSSYDDFTPWYVINGANSNKSFPSGHTAGAAMSFLAMLLPFADDKLMKHKKLLFAVPFVYTCIVAVTRLVMGAHYLSDVAAGGLIGFTVVIVCIKIIDVSKEKWYENVK